MRQRRALRQFTLSTGKSAGRNSSGRITVFHRGGGSKRLQRRIDLKQKTESIGVVERIERAPNRSSRIAPVRWFPRGGVRQCNTIEEFAPPRKILESKSTTTYIFGRKYFKVFALLLVLLFHWYSGGEILEGFVAACDGRREPSFDPIYPPQRDAQPAIPQPEVQPVPRAILVPELEHPLLSDRQRRAELQTRLAFFFQERNEARHLPIYLGILDKQFLVEKRVEAALVQDGFSPQMLSRGKWEIRSILFSHPTRVGTAIAENTLNRYLAQMEREGTRQSLPYLRVIRASRFWV
ncbi:hypothetical protein P3S68_015644 [Capsicum galapagoense]